MKILFQIVILLVLQQASAQSETTIIYFIRHAEKEASSPNPELSEEGIIRAVRWTTYFEKIPIAVFYTTLTQRTQMTCSTIATSKQKDMFFYDASTFSIQEIITKHTGKTILVVGHSNSIPKQINSFLGEEVYPQMDENEFGNLYTLTIEGNQVEHKLTHHK